MRAVNFTAKYSIWHRPETCVMSGSTEASRRSNDMTLYQRGEAADYLTERSGVRFKSEGLAALATKGTGPSFSIFNGRAVYSTEALDEWLAGHLAGASPA